jgi:hypothetical protein
MVAETVDVPQVVRGRDTLVVPAGTDVLRLARAWFPDAVWTRRPGGAASVAPPLGARFRGVPAPAEPPRHGTGTIRLDALTDLHGPRTLTAAEAAAAGYRTPGAVDAYELSISGRSPVGARDWLLAAARRSGGLVDPADGTGPLVPDPSGVVDLALWSAVPLAADEAVLLLRPALAGGRLGEVRVGHVAAGPAPFAVQAHFAYDGLLSVAMDRPADPPAVLGSLDWREFGPWRYRFGWTSPHDDDLGDGSSPLTAIARGRIRPTIARLVIALWQRAGGTVLDAGGFVVAPPDLLDQASRR